MDHLVDIVFCLCYDLAISWFQTLKSSCVFWISEKAFGDDGELKQPKELSINKVGHGNFAKCFFYYKILVMFGITNVNNVFVGAALHELDPLYKEFTYSSKVSSLVSSLGYRRPVIMQSMYIFKVLLFTFRCFLFLCFTTLRSMENTWLQDSMCWFLFRIRNWGSHRTGKYSIVEYAVHHFFLYEGYV